MFSSSSAEDRLVRGAGSGWAHPEKQHGSWGQRKKMGEGSCGGDRLRRMGGTHREAAWGSRQRTDRMGARMRV